MKQPLQLEFLKKDIDRLQKLHGNPQINAIYGAGKTDNPKYLFLFMNPTARNVSAKPEWRGIRAPWIGTKNVWRLFNKLEILDDDHNNLIQSNPPEWWTEEYSSILYNALGNKSVYITNLAKCTQDDARPLTDKVFKEYLINTLREIEAVNPKIIISFGNQVSSVLLGKKISVSKYQKDECETLTFNGVDYKVYPSFYPVGQGTRNIPKAIKRINYIMSH